MARPTPLEPTELVTLYALVQRQHLNYLDDIARERSASRAQVLRDIIREAMQPRSDVAAVRQ